MSNPDYYDKCNIVTNIDGYGYEHPGFEFDVGANTVKTLDYLQAILCDGIAEQEVLRVVVSNGIATLFPAGPNRYSKRALIEIRGASGVAETLNGTHRLTASNATACSFPTTLLDNEYTTVGTVRTPPLGWELISRSANNKKMVVKSLHDRALPYYVCLDFTVAGSVNVQQAPSVDGDGNLVAPIPASPQPLYVNQSGVYDQSTFMVYGDARFFALGISYASRRQYPTIGSDSRRYAQMMTFCGAGETAAPMPHDPAPFLTVTNNGMTATFSARTNNGPVLAAGAGPNGTINANLSDSLGVPTNQASGVLYNGNQDSSAWTKMVGCSRMNVLTTPNNYRGQIPGMVFFTTSHVGDKPVDEFKFEGRDILLITHTGYSYAQSPANGHHYFGLDFEGWRDAQHI